MEDKDAPWCACPKFCSAFARSLALSSGTWYTREMREKMLKFSLEYKDKSPQA
jgi:hypothetical protein